jgi:alkylation response protein AidB-like acyl-CoA dehydrogenase
MDFRDTPEEAAFRTEVRVFVASHLPKAETMDPSLRDLDGRWGGDTPEEQRFVAQWRRAVAQKGWIAPHWPKEYGGAGMSAAEQFIFNEELASARAPQIHGLGVTHIGPILIRAGTEDQKQEHLSRITSGEVTWCQGYSEPGAGSDLAGIQTTAVRDGDEYIVNGQKIWSSGAHRADWMFMLVRTDPTAPKHRGISMLVLPLSTPGITMQPIVDIANDHHFNQEYFDNVRVPAKNRVGEENAGWYLGAALLDHERSMIGPIVKLRHTIDDILELARDARTHPVSPVRLTPAMRIQLAERAVEVDIVKLLSYRLISLQKRGIVPNYEASMSRLFYTETEQRVARTGMGLIGLLGGLFKEPRYAPLEGRISHLYLRSIALTIAGGTSEIQRNVIATRGLSLPRS